MDTSGVAPNQRWLGALSADRGLRRNLYKVWKQREEIIGLAIARSLVSCLCLLFL